MNDMDALHHDPLVPFTADIWVRLSRLPQLLRGRDPSEDDPTDEDETQ